MARPTIGLALGGGGARGAAHIGALQVLESNQIPIDKIAGTSAGAIIGAMYAGSMDALWVEDRFRQFLKSDLFKDLGTDRINEQPPTAGTVFGQIAKKLKNQVVLAMSLHRDSIIKRSRLQEAFDYLIPVKTFEALKLPLQVVATDLNTCSHVVYDSGDVVEAVTRSGTIPGFVEPTEANGSLIVDGGASMPLPTGVIRDSVDVLLAVDIRRRGVKPLSEKNIYEIMMRSDMSTYQNLINHCARLADVLISPEVKDHPWSSFDHFDFFFENGTQSGQDALESIHAEISKKKSLNYRLKQWFGHQN